MNLLVLTTGDFGCGGGIAKFNRDILHSLSQAGHDVTAIPLEAKQVANKPPNIRHLGALGRTRYFRPQHLYGRAALAVMSYGPFDAMLCGHLYLLPQTFWARKWQPSCPVITFVHGIEAWRPTPRPAVNRLASQASGIIAVSRHTLEHFVSWAQPRAAWTAVLANTVDLHRFAPGERDPVLVQRHRLAHQKVLMTMGRMASDERYKGFDELLELMAPLRRQVPNLVYVAVGDGDDRPRLMRKAAALGVAPWVRFVGAVSEAQKVAYLRLADCFAMPSTGEGFGIVYLEALACGVPVVAGNTDGSAEALMHGALGCLVEPRDADALRDAIIAALQSPPLNAQHIRQGLQNFSSERFDAQLRSLIGRTQT